MIYIPTKYKEILKDTFDNPSHAIPPISTIRKQAQFVRSLCKSSLDPKGTL